MPVKDLHTDFLSLDNFRLAWERVLRSQHADNKDRIAQRTFAFSVTHNLEQLIQEITTDTYQATSAYKIYIPKVSRTLRTIPVLTVRDRVVYQAIGNLIAREAYSDLSVLTNRHVFAHLPQSNESLFTLVPWKGQFRKFKEAYERIWKQGNKWVVEADISSFYASIDHGLLIELIRERWISDDEFLKLLKNCLWTWTAHEHGPRFDRGLPQGYETSDLLATLFLMPVDESLIRQYRYLRYVDDIRILTHSRETASKALVKLDLELQSRALVLQTKKTGLEEVEDLDQENDKLRRKLSQIDVYMVMGRNPQDELKELFFEAWNQLEHSPKASDPALAFTLYRLGPDTTVRNIALRLLDILPWRSPVINRYLEKFVNEKRTAEAVIGILRNHKVYAWHLAHCMRTLAKIAAPSVYREIALEWINNKQLQWFQRLAAVEALQQDRDSHVALYEAIKSEENNLVKSAMIVACAFQAHADGNQNEIALLIRRALGDRSHEIRMLAIWLRQEFPTISWNEINFQGSLGSFRALIPELATQPGEVPCYIKDTLRKMYGVQINEMLDFTKVFGDYSGTVLDFRKANLYYSTDPSLYIGLINSFNHRITIALKPVTNSSIPDDQLGNMLNSQGYKTKVPQIALYFGQCNDTRNQTTGFHPFASALGTWSQTLTHKQKEALHNGLKLAYQEFVAEYEKYLGIT